MSDILDHASDTSQFLNELALRQRKIIPEKTGHCLNCEEPVEAAYCDMECRIDHEKRMKRLA